MQNIIHTLDTSEASILLAYWLSCNVFALHIKNFNQVCPHICELLAERNDTFTLYSSMLCSVSAMFHMLAYCSSAEKLGHHLSNFKSMLHAEKRLMINKLNFFKNIHSMSQPGNRNFHEMNICILVKYSTKFEWYSSWMLPLKMC